MTTPQQPIHPTPAADFVLTTAHANQNSDETMRQAREHAAAHDGATVAIWDDMSDPTNIGWILRTFTANGDWTDENV